jgi:hypothetical protein
VLTDSDADQQMLDWLCGQVGTLEEGRAAMARIAELMQNEAAVRRSLVAVQDAHKLAMAQLEFAQSVVKRHQRQLETAGQGEVTGAAAGE